LQIKKKKKVCNINNTKSGKKRHGTHKERKQALREKAQKKS